jgi:hypothetical protein
MRYLAFCLLGIFLLPGCGSGPATATVSGEVKKSSGETMGGVTVVFHSSSGEMVPTKTDASGQFKTAVATGMAKISIVEASEATSGDTSMAALNSKPKQSRFKAKFSAPESSGLSCDVGKQKDKLVLIVD